RKLRSAERTRRSATRKSCRASASSRAASRPHPTRASSSRARPTSAAAAGAGRASRSTGGLLIVDEAAQVFGTKEPVERGRPFADRAGEFEQAGRALAQLEEG